MAGADGYPSANVQRRWIIRLASLLIPLFLLGAVAPPVSAQIIETVVGGGVGDGGSALTASIGFPTAVTADTAGNLYIVDQSNQRIRKVKLATGVIATVAGNGSGSYNGDNIAATSATLDPQGIAFDLSGNLYIADGNRRRIRKVAAATGIITTIAGTDAFGVNGDNIAATRASLGVVSGVAVDPIGNVYIAEQSSHSVRKVTAATGIITTVAGGVAGGFNGDNIAATSAAIFPGNIALDSSGNLYIEERSNPRIRKVNAATGIITTVAGTGTTGYNGDDIAATSAMLSSITGLAVDASGNLYIADSSNHRVRKVAVATGIITTIAGIGGFGGYNGDNISAVSAALFLPVGIALDSSGSLYIADAVNQRIRKVTASTGIITTVAGNGGGTFGGDDIAATSSTLNAPTGVVVAPSGDLYIADQQNHRVRKVTATTGIVTTVAGTGSAGFIGDNDNTSDAALNNPSYVALDSTGSLYIADRGNHRVRKLTTTGIITTFAGTGTAGYSGDSILATTARLNVPTGLAVDSSDNLYIVDQGNNRIRKVNAAGIITTVAGMGLAGYTGDGIAATEATLNHPTGVAVDLLGNLYIADTFNRRTRKVTAATGIITTVVGIGTPLNLNDNRLGVDNIAATSTALGISYAVAVDATGNLYVTDGSRVRKVTGATGVITTLVGTGVPGYNGDSNDATSAALYNPAGVAVDPVGNLYVADTGNNRIRKVSVASVANYQGLWWNAPAGSESGWGVNFAHQGNDIFATWFTYDATGKALWLSMTASKIGPEYIGTLYQTRGPVFSALPFSPAAVTRTAVGSGTLTFSDTSNARFAYIFNGTTQTKSITRQVFGQLPTCIFGAPVNLTNFQDLWWAAPGGIESGWGVNFTHQGDTIFATWFTYDADGTPLWLSATATKTGAGVYAGLLYRTTGPAFNAAPFLPAGVSRTVVGTLTLTFNDGNSGTFAYTAYGVVQSKSITRQVFNVPGTVCQSR